MDKSVEDYLSDLLTLEEAARLLRVKPQVLRRWAKEGRHGLRVYSRAQRVLLFKRSELVKLLERSERERKMSANGKPIILVGERASQASLILESLDLPARVISRRWPSIARQGVDSPLYAALWEAGVLALRRAASRYDCTHSSGASFTTYAWRWVEGSMLDVLARYQFEPSFDAGTDTEHEPTASFWDTVLTDDEADEVRRVLAELEQRDELAATAFRLHRGNGWSLAEVAEVLGTSKSTAYALVKKAERLLAAIAKVRPPEAPVHEAVRIRGVWKQRSPRRRNSRRDWSSVGSFDERLLQEDDGTGRGDRTDYARELEGDWEGLPTRLPVRLPVRLPEEG